MTQRLIELVDERKDLAKRAREIIVSMKDNSKLYYTIQSIIKDTRKISNEELTAYEKTYSVCFPKDFRRFVLTFGSDGYLNHSVVDFKTNKIWKPEFYMSDSFYCQCIINKIDDEILDDFSDLYQVTGDIFKNEMLNEVYQQMEKNFGEIHKLLYLGRNDCGSGDFLCLEGEFKGLIVHSGNWASKTIEINGINYSKYHYGTFGKTYFEYLEDMFESANKYLKNEIRKTVENK